MSSYDIIVIGAGHNGLVCAAYLARAGQRVLVLEARECTGGAAGTSEIKEGYRVSACAHIAHMLSPRVVNDLALERHGLGYSRQAMKTVVLDAGGRHLVLDPDPARRHESLLEHSLADADRLGEFERRIERFAEVLAPLITSVPPRLGTRDWGSRAVLAKLGWRIRRLGRTDMREFLRVIGMNIADWVEDTFESDAVRAAIAFDAVLGTHLGPRSPGSVLTLLHRRAGERGTTLAHPAGGMGGVTAAMTRAAQAHGVEIRTAAPVERILVEGDRASGVVLRSGEEFRAPVVASSADPKQTFLGLLGTAHLDTGFVRRVRNIRMHGNAAKLNLALKALPAFAGLGEELAGERLLIAPDVDYLERAFDHAKYGEYSTAPAMEITLPSVHDATLAADGKHVLSAVVQYAPYDLRAGWDKSRRKFEKVVLDTLSAYAPGIRKLIVAKELLTPADLERTYWMTGGHWHHGELAFDQFLMLRPVPGAAQYTTPMAGLYLCGAGSHPGGGVTGTVGFNAAQQIIAMEVGE